MKDAGEGRGGHGSPLFLDQTEARGAEKFFFGDQAPLYLRVWMTAPSSHPPPPLTLSEGLDQPLSLQVLFPLKPVESPL